MKNEMKKVGGGGVDSLLSTSNNKNNNENKKCITKVATRKWQTNERRDLAKLIMWLLVFSIMFVLSLQPVFASKSKISQAGQLSDGTFYPDAPATKISNGTALFTTSGVNTSVILDLLEKINSTKVWENSKTENEVTYLSAKNFGQYDDTTGNAQIVLKLLDKTSKTANNANLFSQQYWQVVYRSTNETEDVLTLYMCRPYTKDYFDNTSPKYGDYSHSDIRTLLKNTYTTITSSGLFPSLNDYIAVPKDLATLNLGGWQSSSYQTANLSSGSSFGTGASEVYHGAGFYAIENGLDGESTAHSSWTTGVAPAYNDKLWLPSNYEIIYTDSTKDGSTSYVSYSSSSGYSLKNETSGANEDGRSGLWELNGYDRAWAKENSDTLTSWAWLRSGYSFSGNLAREVRWNGSLDYINVNDTFGVRPALHLNLKSLANLVFASVSASADASGTPVDASVSSPKGWASTNNLSNVTDFYKYMVDKDSSETNGKATVTLETTDKQINSIEFKYKDSNNEDATETVIIANPTQSGTVDGICSYKCGTDASGKPTIELSNVKTNVKVVANMIEKITSCTTTLDINLSLPTNVSTQIIVNVIKGTKDNYDYTNMYQIVVGKDQEVDLILDGSQTYTIVVSKPYTWGITFVALDDGDGTQIGDYYEFTTSGQTRKHQITITGGGIPNIWVVI